MKKIYLGFLICSMFSFVYAEKCDSYQMDKAQYYAQHYAEQVVNNKFDGGQDITENIESCDYNTYGNYFDLKVNIYWHGSVFYSHTYEADGELTFDQDGSNPKFKVSWMNYRLKKYLSNMKMISIVVGTAFALSAMDQQQQDQQ